MRIAWWQRRRSTELRGPVPIRGDKVQRAAPSPNGVAASDGRDYGPADTLFGTDGRVVVQYGDTEVVVFRTRRGVFAVENHCPHMNRRLTDAAVTTRSLTCAGHGYRYDISSGRRVGAQARSTPGLRSFDAAIDDGRLWLRPRANPAPRAAARTGSNGEWQVQHG